MYHVILQKLIKLNDIALQEDDTMRNDIYEVKDLKYYT